MRTRKLLSVLSLALVLAACEVGPVDPGAVPDCSGNKCDGESFEPFQVVHCEHSQAVGLECWFTQPREGHPLALQASITALATPLSSSVAGRLGTRQFTRTENAIVLPAPATAEYPILVVVSLDVGSAPGRATRVGDAGTLSTSFRIERPTDSSHSFDLPFMAWPVSLEVEDENGAFINGHAGPVTLELAPFETFFNEPTAELETELLVRGPTELGFLLPVGAEGIEVRGQYCYGGCTDLQFTIPAPGRYRIGASGLVQLEDEPAIETDGGLVDAGPGETDAGPEVDAGPPAPTCGTEGQAPCAEGCAEWHEETSGTCHECGAEGQSRCRGAGGASVCQPQHRWDASAGQCRACGGDGQTYCGTSTSRTCDDGHRFSYDDDLCHACGGDGQTYCGTSSSRTCSDGHRHSYDDNLCHVCGGDGQTYCGTSSSRTCDDGHRFSYDDDLCHVCGGDGQTYCGTSSSRTCSDGHRHSYDDNLCHVCGGDGQTYCGSPSNRTCDEGHEHSFDDNLCHAV